MWIVRRAFRNNNQRRQDEHQQPSFTLPDHARNQPLVSRLHTTILLDTYRFMDRCDLTICQLVCRRWILLVERNAEYLPINGFYHLELSSKPLEDNKQQTERGQNSTPSDSDFTTDPKPRLFNESRCCDGITGCEWEVSKQLMIQVGSLDALF